VAGARPAADGVSPAAPWGDGCGSPRREDVVADTLPRLAADPRLPDAPGPRSAYVRRGLWRDALDELRHRRGRDLSARPPESLPIDAAAEMADPSASAEAELAADQEREHKRAAVARTLARLPRRDAELLRLCFLDELAPDAVAAEFGVTRDQYRRRLLSASRRALDALVESHSGPACP
jgi:RNA polymerase sigma factor (sigma-70 family)